ncbi:hypothetical protein HYPSUDRAFT_48485 [Hypholoma sublateritium FD-334 SS-4]|uniref:Uncharacterized protein n=1 Tax=Hypholoma sublateritium (strain FD-334 SS-4) TaxID=945553 RepID=A0A0D2P4D3_HYPSF|nr:hypothetical protein HYPSUDRAFT_48485 [Hypholoma sublateritium FD-334 SS-4]
MGSFTRPPRARLEMSRYLHGGTLIADTSRRKAALCALRGAYTRSSNHRNRPLRLSSGRA